MATRGRSQLTLMTSSRFIWCHQRVKMSVSPHKRAQIPRKRVTASASAGCGEEPHARNHEIRESGQDGGARASSSRHYGSSGSSVQAGVATDPSKRLQLSTSPGPQTQETRGTAPDGLKGRSLTWDQRLLLLLNQEEKHLHWFQSQNVQLLLKTRLYFLGQSPLVARGVTAGGSLAQHGG